MGGLEKNCTEDGKLVNETVTQGLVEG
jgi:hypothetical protein